MPDNSYFEDDYIEINRAAYDILSRDYEKRISEKSIYEEKPASLVDPVLKHAKIYFEKITVLEIGPGSGEILSYFENRGCRTVAVELSQNMLCLAKNRSPATIFLLGNILDSNFADAQFEVIYAGALIHLFPLTDARRLLARMHSWLKPNGFLFVNTTVHAKSEEGIYAKLDYGSSMRRFRKRWTENEFISELKMAGFEPKDRLFTDEKNRQKKWVAFICRKNEVP